MKSSIICAAVGWAIALNAQTPLPGGSKLRFRPLAPCRVMDTRETSGFMGSFGKNARPIANAIRTVPIGSSVCDVPIDPISGVRPTVRAWALNVTLVPFGPDIADTVRMWPTGQAEPGTAVINNPNSRILAQNVVMPTDATGSVNLKASGKTDILIDVNGFFTDSEPSLGLVFYPMTPCRAVNTFLPAGSLGGPALSASAARSFPIKTSGCGIPPQAQAYFMNVTVIPGNASPGYMTVYPSGIPERPLASTLNMSNSVIVANGGIFQAGGNGDITVFADQPAHVLLDVFGYFAPAGGAGGLELNTINPCRALFEFPLASQADTALSIPAACGGGTNTKAYAMSVTLKPNASLGFLTMWPSGASRPVISLQNAVQGWIVGNGVLLGAGTGQGVSAYVDNSGAKITLDINGYFTEAAGGGSTIPAVINSPLAARGKSPTFALNM